MPSFAARRCTETDRSLHGLADASLAHISARPAPAAQATELRADVDCPNQGKCYKARPDPGHFPADMSTTNVKQKKGPLWPLLN